MNTNKIRLLCLIALLIALYAVLCFLLNPPEPRLCALCDAYKRHAPCLVDLSTGEVGELAIYESHPELFGEIAEEQPGGKLVYRNCAGLRATADSGRQICVVTVPDNWCLLRKGAFCRDCRKLLSGFPGRYVLADLYISGEPRVFPMEAGAQYEMRCYQVSVDEALNLTVCGTFR